MKPYRLPSIRMPHRKVPAAMVVWLLLLACVVGRAPAQGYSFVDYSQAHGLEGLAVAALVEDRDGVVWVGTKQGLHRYERGRFTLVPRESGLDSIYVRALALDHAGRLWVGTSLGLYVRGADGRFTSVLDGSRRAPPDVGNTLVAYRDGVAMIHQGSLVAVQPGGDEAWHFNVLPMRMPEGSSSQVGDALLAEGDVLWMHCERQLCRRAADGGVQRHGEADGLPPAVWQALFIDRGGTLWLRGGGDVMVRPAGSARFEPRPPPAGSSFALLTGASNFVEDARGRVLTRSDDGIVRWEHDHWRAFERHQGLGITRVASNLLVQRNGWLWIGTMGQGVQRWLAYDQMEHWGEQQGLATAPVWSIIESGPGSLLLGADGGSHHLDTASGRLRTWTLADGRPLQQVTAMARAPDGAIWLGSSSGMLSRRDPASGRTEEVVMASLGVRTLVFDEAGDLWIGTRRGAMVIRAGSRSVSPVEDLPLAGFGEATIDRFGRLWMMSTEGLFLLRDGRWQQIEVSTPLPGSNFSHLSVARDGEIWFSLGDAGVWRGRLDSRDRLHAHPVEDSLAARMMPYVLRHDRRGWLWLGSSQGLDVYHDGHWTRVTQAEGLLWDDTSANAFLEDQDGTVWIGNSRGVSRITDPAALFAQTPLRVSIDGARHGDSDVQPGAVLPWSDRAFEAELATPGASGGERIAFRYRIEGHQRDWSQTTQSRISYPMLPDGRHTLQVQAVDERQRSASPIVELRFEILPPWWRSPVAILCYVVAGVGLILLLVRWRIQHLLLRERDLERLVTERTLELERDKLALEAARSELAFKASHDALTGTLNRTGVIEAMTLEMDNAVANGTPLAVALIDLDHFKQINDQHGHLVGDGVLYRTGRRLHALLRDEERIGRYGGEELLAVLPRLPAPALHRLRAFHDAICKTPYAVDARMLLVTCSIGVAWYRPGESAEQLLARADDALYRAKHDGRNRIELEDTCATAA